MSIGFFRKGADGKRHYYSVSVPLFPVLALLGILIAILLPLLQALRVWLRG